MLEMKTSKNSLRLVMVRSSRPKKSITNSLTTFIFMRDSFGLGYRRGVRLLLVELDCVCSLMELRLELEAC